MSVAGYGKIEREDTDVPFSRLEQIAHTFNMKIEDLVGFDEQIVYNIMHNQTGINHFYNGSVSNDIIESFKKTIKLLEEKVARLEKGQN